MDIVGLIIQLLSGAAGGNIIGTVLKNLSLGTVGNSLAGIIGGALGGQLLGPLLTGPGAGAIASGNLDLSAIISQIVSGGAGGGVLMAIVGLIRSVMAK